MFDDENDYYYFEMNSFKNIFLDRSATLFLFYFFFILKLAESQNHSRLGNPDNSNFIKFEENKH